MTGTECFFAAEGEEPFLAGTIEAEGEDGRCLVQPHSGGSPIWMPRDAVFNKSPSDGAHPDRLLALVLCCWPAGRADACVRANEAECMHAAMYAASCS